MRGPFATIPPMRNIELKARLVDAVGAADLCQRLGAQYRGDIHQTDTYFNVPSGRLKLRENVPGNTELIYYRRADQTASKGSDYEIAPGSPPLRDLLAGALGVGAVVRKLRRLWLWHNVRIHIDTVDRLGDFIEFEAVLDEPYDDQDGHAKIAQLRAAFDIDDTHLIAHSYLDLLTTTT